jgi:hypothetical protein
MKVKKRPSGPWQATGMQRERLAKGDPVKLKMRATELKLKAERLIKEADELELRAEELERSNTLLQIR